MDFVAIDVETANPDMSSICQVGLAGFKDGALVSEWKSYVDPETWFASMNINIHGITEQTVSGAPTLPKIENLLRSSLEGNVVLCHTPFDRVATYQAFDLHSLRPLQCTWLDSARVARRTWSQFSLRGYGLANVCELIGYDFAHHDALEDAKAAGHILLAAMSATGLSVEDWLLRAERSIDPNRSGSKGLMREGNPDGPLFGEVVVFTGALQIRRQEAADLACRVGCEVGDNVTQKTSMLVVGDQDITKLAGYEKSSKHRKAEALVAQGQPIRILRESDFTRLVALES